eukprot:COSAG01_NODE_6485_length_3638_cov_43.071207_7_plen_102_part_00
MPGASDGAGYYKDGVPGCAVAASSGRPESDGLLVPLPRGAATVVVSLALSGAPRARAGAPQAARTPDSGTTIPLRVHRWPPGEAGAGRYARLCTGSQSLAS